MSIRAGGCFYIFSGQINYKTRTIGKQICLLIVRSEEPQIFLVLFLVHVCVNTNKPSYFNFRENHIEQGNMHNNTAHIRVDTTDFMLRLRLIILKQTKVNCYITVFKHTDCIVVEQTRQSL